MFDLDPLVKFAVVGLIAIVVVILTSPFWIYYLWKHISIGWNP